MEKPWPALLYLERQVKLAALSQGSCMLLCLGATGEPWQVGLEARQCVLSGQEAAGTRETVLACCVLAAGSVPGHLGSWQPSRQLGGRGPWHPGKHLRLPECVLQAEEAGGRETRMFTACCGGWGLGGLGVEVRGWG